MLHLFDQKYSRNCSIVKYLYSLKSYFYSLKIVNNFVFEYI